MKKQISSLPKAVFLSLCPGLEETTWQSVVSAAGLGFWPVIPLRTFVVYLFSKISKNQNKNKLPLRLLIYLVPWKMSF